MGQFVSIQKMDFLGFYKYLCKYFSNLAENFSKMGTNRLTSPKETPQKYAHAPELIKM